MAKSSRQCEKTGGDPLKYEGQHKYHHNMKLNEHWMDGNRKEVESERKSTYRRTFQFPRFRQ